jgi:hypothetical protein
VNAGNPAACADRCWVGGLLGGLRAQQRTRGPLGVEQDDVEGMLSPADLLALESGLKRSGFNSELATNQGSV